VKKRKKKGDTRQLGVTISRSGEERKNQRAIEEKGKKGANEDKEELGGRKGRRGEIELGYSATDFIPLLQGPNALEYAGRKGKGGGGKGARGTYMKREGGGFV